MAKGRKATAKPKRVVSLKKRLSALRRELRKLNGLAKSQGLSANLRTTIEGTVQEVRSIKAQLLALGYVAGAPAKSKSKIKVDSSGTKLKGKRLSISPPKSRSANPGVGMYGLGSGLKIWR